MHAPWRIYIISVNSMFSLKKKCWTILKGKYAEIWENATGSKWKAKFLSVRAGEENLIYIYSFLLSVHNVMTVACKMFFFARKLIAQWANFMCINKFLLYLFFFRTISHTLSYSFFRIEPSFQLKFLIIIFFPSVYIKYSFNFNKSIDLFSQCIIKFTILRE